MNKTSKVKLVKRDSVAKRAVGKRLKAPSHRAAAREIVSTVTEWVADLKQRKSEETKAAFDLLFSSQPRPTGS